MPLAQVFFGFGEKKAAKVASKAGDAADAAASKAGDTADTVAKKVGLDPHRWALVLVCA